MKIIWEVDDGYVGGSRPQTTEIDEWDIENCDDIDEAMQMIDDEIKADYNQKISWYMNNRERIQEKVQEILDNKEEKF